jgi:hypothetical protein
MTTGNFSLLDITTNEYGFSKEDLMLVKARVYFEKGSEAIVRLASMSIL